MGWESGPEFCGSKLRLLFIGLNPWPQSQAVTGIVRKEVHLMICISTAPNGLARSWAQGTGNKQQGQGILPTSSAWGHLLLIIVMDHSERAGFLPAFPSHKAVDIQELPSAGHSARYERVSSWNMKWVLPTGTPSPVSRSQLCPQRPVASHSRPVCMRCLCSLRKTCLVHILHF